MAGGLATRIRPETVSDWLRFCLAAAALGLRALLEQPLRISLHTSMSHHSSPKSPEAPRASSSSSKADRCDAYDANIRNFAPVARIMKNALPENAKIAKEAKECMQECVSEFISFITSEGKYNGNSHPVRGTSWI